MRAIVIAAGQVDDDQNWHRWVRDGDLIIGADGGAARAWALGLNPSVVIGDMDSLPMADRLRLEMMDCRFIEHPRAKDETDLELALTHAAESGAQEIVVLGALGGRLDHTFANVLLLSLPRLKGLSVRIVHGGEETQLIHGGGGVTLTGLPGDLVSLIPLAGDVEGVTTTGLAWALEGATLAFGFSWGVSNEMTSSTARIELEKGALLVVHGPPDEA